MAAFSLKSDKEFITPFINGQGVFISTYKGYVNDIKNMIVSYCPIEHWVYGGVSISATGDKNYKALEVFGTIIAGDKLIELCTELRSIQGGSEYVYVNRLGLCILKRSSIKAERINDYSGLSKYGVKVPWSNLIRTSVMSNKLDMSNVETMFVVEGLVRAAGEAEELRRRLEEKNVEMAACKKELEEKNVGMAACKNELEEKNVELVACKKEQEEMNVEIFSCKNELEDKKVEMVAFKKELEEKNVELAACKKEMEEKNVEMVAWKKEMELEWMKKNELLWRKLVEEKEKVDELIKNQHLAFRADYH